MHHQPFITLSLQYMYIFFSPWAFMVWQLIQSIILDSKFLKEALLGWEWYWNCLEDLNVSHTPVRKIHIANVNWNSFGGAKSSLFLAPPLKIMLRNRLMNVCILSNYSFHAAMKAILDVYPEGIPVNSRSSPSQFYITGQQPAANPSSSVPKHFGTLYHFKFLTPLLYQSPKFALHLFQLQFVIFPS